MTGYLKHLTVVAMAAYTLCSIGDITQMVVRFEQNLDSPNWSMFESHLAGSKDAIYYIGNISFFILLLLRIQTSFQVSRLVMGYLALLLVLSVVCSVLWCIIMVYFAGSSGVALDLYLNKTLYSIIIIDFVLNLSLFVLFVHKLRYKDSMEGMEIADDIEFESTLESVGGDYINYDKRAVWNVMIKHCVLFGIALVINELWYMAIVLNKLTDDDYPSSLIRDYVCRSIENSVNLVVLFLVLKVNNDKYIRFCACWHLCILQTCLKEEANAIHEGFADYERQASFPRRQFPDNSKRQPLLNPHMPIGDMAGNALLVTNCGEVNSDIEDNLESSVGGHHVLSTAHD